MIIKSTRLMRNITFSAVGAKRMALNILKLFLIVLVGYLSFTSGSTSFPRVNNPTGNIISSSSSCVTKNNADGLVNISSSANNNSKVNNNNTCLPTKRRMKRNSTSFFPDLSYIISLVYNEKQELTWNNYLIAGIGILGYILVNTIATISLIVVLKIQKVNLSKRKSTIVKTDTTIEKGDLDEPAAESLENNKIIIKDWNDLDKLELQWELMELESTFGN